jgi:hypothetical protein
MALIIDSAPDCVVHHEGASTKDLADFVLQNDYKDCAGFGTFMPGSTYGADGAGANSLYMIITWLGIAVMLAVLAYWVIYENRRLIAASLGVLSPTTPEEPPPQPGMSGGPDIGGGIR